MQPPFFPDGPSAFEYICKYMDCPLAEGAAVPALIMDATEVFGTSEAARTDPDGSHVALLRVASTDGVSLVVAPAVGTIGSRLQPDQLVIWRAEVFSPGFGKKAQDEGFGWIGVILGTLRRSSLWEVSPPVNLGWPFGRSRDLGQLSRRRPPGQRQGNQGHG